MRTLAESVSGAMMTNYFTLRALAGELQEMLQGYHITEIYSQKKNELIFTLRRSGTEDESIIISIDPAFHYLYATGRMVRARKNSVDLFTSIIGHVIEHIEVHPRDRIITIAFSNSASVAFYLFGTAASNIYLIDKERTVLESFKRNAEFRGTPLPADKGETDDHRHKDKTSFIRFFGEHPEKTVISVLKRSVPILGTVYAEEICARAGVEPSQAAGTAAGSACEQLHTELNRFMASLDHPRPTVYEDEKGDSVLTIVPLTVFTDLKAREYPTVLDAAASVVSREQRRRKFEAERDTLLASLRREAEHVRRALAAAETEAGQGERAEEYERRGKLILGNIHLLKGGMTAADVPDIYGDGTKVRITLNPKTSLAQNAERYFQLAKQTRTKLSEAAKRLRVLRHRETAIGELLEQLRNTSSGEELENILRTHRKEFKAMNISRGGREEELPPFRIFKVRGDLDVWVGKNSANNDLLTMRYAKPHDLWFHARGASGSHTVLKVKKNEIVPKEAIRQAAAIAAYYSKMRNSSSVPVAYCERKYVRKPRGAAPGTVILEREELIFIQPGLP